MAFIAQYSSKELFDRKLIVREIKESWNPTKMGDELFFPTDDPRDIFLSKHNRYTPLFTHMHIFFEIVYVASGSCTQTINQDTFTMTQGQFCIISPLTEHSVGVFHDSLIINIVLRRKTFENVFYNLLCHSNRISDFVNKSLYLYQEAGYILLDTHGDSGIYELVLDMYDQYTNAYKYNELMLTCTFNYLFSQILQRYEEDIFIPETPFSGNQDVFHIISYIETHFQDVTLAETANHFGYSQSYLSRFIKKHTSRSFTDIVLGIKFDKACHMLENTNISINEIAYQTGFENNENFYRTFKKRYHMTPGEYRDHSKSVVVSRP